MLIINASHKQYNMAACNEDDYIAVVPAGRQVSPSASWGHPHCDTVSQECSQSAGQVGRGGGIYITDRQLGQTDWSWVADADH